MDPNDIQFSINDPFNDNAVRCPRYTLPRSFKPTGHGIGPCGAFYDLLTAHRGLHPTGHREQAYRAFKLSWDSLRLSKEPLLGLSGVWGNSRACVLASVQGNQTRTVSHERQAYGVSSNLSIYHSLDPILDHFSLACIGGRSRTFVRSIIRGNQTRILFILDRLGGSFWDLVTAHQFCTKLDVPYTVITGT